MARPVSGEVKTSQVRVKKENGDIYVFERKRKYDPKVGYTRTFDYRLIGKIKAGTDTIVPTRPRRKPEQGTRQEKTDAVEAVDWGHNGVTDILEQMGKMSGIDHDLRRCLDEGRARKVITIARYITANPSQTLPRLPKWQRTHPSPCETELNRKNCQTLMEELGEDKAAQLAYFKCRTERAGKSDLLAIDSTTVSTYSENLNFARQGFNKDHDGLDTVKLLTIYSLKTRQPIAVIKQPGNIPDVISIEYALKQLNWLHVDSFKVITDNGFYSLDNVTRFVRGNIKFLTRISKEISWVKSEIKAHRDELFTPNAIKRDETNTHGISLMINKELSWVRQRSRNGGRKGDIEKKTVWLYLYIFLDRNEVAEDEQRLLNKLVELQKQIESGVTEFTSGAQKMIDKFLETTRKGKRITTCIRDVAWKEAQKDFGIFVLISNQKNETFEALGQYRLREKIEEGYRLQKGQADGNCTRAWYDDNYTGHVFCQMVALGYQLYFQNAVARVKETLLKDLASDSEKASDKKAKEALKKWLDQQSLVGILDWFDCIEQTQARRDGERLTLRTELTSRDKLFLKLLMETEGKASTAPASAEAPSVAETAAVQPVGDAVSATRKSE